jgi:hypothetical protein
LQHLEKCGAETAVAYSLDEALVTLEFWGVIKRDVAYQSVEISRNLAGENV